MEKQRILTVTQLNLYVKSLLESSSFLKEIYISGEISNFTNHYRTGHFYLSLKDDTGLIKAVMFRQNASKLKFELKNGMKIICRGKVSLYERDGQYQLYIEDIQPDGVGDLHLAFEQLTEKLKNEGLFDESKKRKLPKIPTKVAVITSPTGAAVKDIISVLNRRFPLATVIMCPVIVQGDTAPPQLIQAIKEVNKLRCADVIIIGRGGGSLEELWAFNDEALARTIRASAIPVISAVGHETDFTICDFAADLRAPTPSAAAELCVPDTAELLNSIRNKRAILHRSLQRIFETKTFILKALMDKPCLRSPHYMIEVLKLKIDKSTSSIFNSYNHKVKDYRKYLSVEIGKLHALSPLAVLSRGYSILYANDSIIKSVDNLNISDDISVKTSDGEVFATVTEIKKGALQ